MAKIKYTPRHRGDIRYPRRLSRSQYLAPSHSVVVSEAEYNRCMEMIKTTIASSYVLPSAQRYVDRLRAFLLSEEKKTNLLFGAISDEALASDLSLKKNLNLANRVRALAIMDVRYAQEFACLNLICRLRDTFSHYETVEELCRTLSLPPTSVQGVCEWLRNLPSKKQTSEVVAAQLDSIHQLLDGYNY